MIALFFALLLSACGSKGNPVPKETLNIPPPDWVDVALGEDGVIISNSSEVYPVVAERAASEVGDLGFPDYEQVAIVPPDGTYVDNTTERDVRYLYRFRSAHDRYYAFSDPVTRVVSYRGAVQVERLDYVIRNNTLCPAVQLSASTSYVETLINGQKVTADMDGCYMLPLTTQILLVMVPYSESGTPGSAYSATITRTDDTLLPPQNLRVLRRGENVTLSWDAVPLATGYRVSVGRDTVNIGETLLNWKADADCVEFFIQSVRNEEISAPVTAESCM